ncbi:MAG: hypothetical protein ABIG80_02355 [Patescibacteria group bacterium]
MVQVLAMLARLSKAGTTECLQSAGYHRHKGQWRKQRVREGEAMSENVPAPPEVTPEKVSSCLEIIQAAREGGEGSREALEQLLDQYPVIASMYGDLADVAEDKLLTLTTKDNVLDRTTTQRFLEAMRRSLVQPGDGYLEHLLIERVVFGWATLAFAEKRRAQKWCQDITSTEALFWDRRVSSLQSDFLKASRALAELRRLTRPTVLAQMNIAEKQQINISAAPQPTPAADAE